MDIEELREYCLKKSGVHDCFPFDEETLVFKVGSKMFCLSNLSKSFTVNLKCEPGRAIELREEYEEIQPGFHMNKKHWNTIDLEGRLTDKFIKELINESYKLVIRNMTKKERILLNLDN